MGTSTINTLQVSDDGLDLATHWIADSALQWKKLAKPVAADWLRLLDSVIPDNQDKGRVRIKQLATSAKLSAPPEVITRTKQFVEKLNHSFKSDFQRDASPAEISLHALIAMSTEDSFGAEEKQTFSEIIDLLKS